jgi:hypothetical protein
MSAQLPTAVALSLCRMVIIEEKTRNVTLANIFQKFEVKSFPSPPFPMVVYVLLTDGLGEIDLKLTVTRCATLDEIYARSLTINFPDPLQQVRLQWQIRSCSFPLPGTYEFGLQARGELITQCVIQVIAKGEEHG